MAREARLLVYLRDGDMIIGEWGPTSENSFARFVSTICDGLNSVRHVFPLTNSEGDHVIIPLANVQSIRAEHRRSDQAP